MALRIIVYIYPDQNSENKFCGRPGGVGLAILSRQFRTRASQLTLLVASLIIYPFAAVAEQPAAPGFALRNQNPFLQIFGLPPFQSATLAPEGAVRYDVNLDLANHADAGDNAQERFVIDGESYFLTLSLRRRVKHQLELGVDLPLVAHGEGFLDNGIEGWHDTFGMSNTKRRGPSNQLGFLYSGPGSNQYELASPAFGIGDIQLTAAVPLKGGGDTDKISVAVRSSIKLPTGAEEELRGSGAVDFSVGLYAADTHTLWKRELGLSGFAGVLLLGDGDVLTSMQRSAVPFGGAAATWQVTQNFGATAQLYTQGAYFDSELKELGGDSVQLAVGGNYRLPRRGVSLSFAIVEDVTANATTDFALHFSVRTVGGR